MSIRLLIALTCYALVLLCMANCSRAPGQGEIAQSSQTDRRSALQNEELQDTSLVFDCGAGFAVKANRWEEFDDLKVYSHIELFNGGTIVFRDTTNEYELDGRCLPMVRGLRDSSYEVMLTLNQRPFDNQLRLLRVKGDHVVRDIKLPMFYSEPRYIGTDSLPRVAGSWGSGEVWDMEQGTVKAYDPILYFVVSDTGIYLDSAMTQLRNAMIYGKFLGYNFDDTHPCLLSICDTPFVREVRRISSSKSAP